MTESVVVVRRDGAVATLTLNRPERRNAIDQAMRDALRAALHELDVDDTARCVVLTGAGTAFCAGVDLAEGEDPTVARPGGRPPVAEPLWAFSKPVLAALNGPAVGGGLELALACDVRMAAESARFGLTEVRLGSLPGSGGTQLLPRIVGSSHAARLLLTGDLVDAAEAMRIGLVTEVVPDADLEAGAAALAARIAANAPLSLLAAKRALRAARDLPFADGQALERRLWTDLATSEDRAEGRAAFRERRSPRFAGR